MAAINFPDSPTVTDEFTDANSVVWVCTGTSPNIWERRGEDAGALTSANNLSDVANAATSLSNLAGAPLASPTFTGTVILGGQLSMADNVIARPKFQDTSDTLSAIGNTGATQTFDCTVANTFTATLDQASTFTFSNPPASGSSGFIFIEGTNFAAFTITWPTSVDWEGGTAPTLTAAGVDLLSFYTRDAGTTWHGMVLSTDSK